MSVRVISKVVNGECFSVIHYPATTYGSAGEGDSFMECYEVRKQTPILFPGDGGRNEVITVTNHRATAMAVFREACELAKDC